MIVLSVPREYYGRPEEIHIDFDELFQMYNDDALDKSLMSCYCLRKILDCKSKNILNIGFIDPDKIHIATLTDKPKETEENLLRVWKRFKCVTPGNFPEKLTFRAAQIDTRAQRDVFIDVAAADLVTAAVADAEAWLIEGGSGRGWSDVPNGGAGGRAGEAGAALSGGGVLARREGCGALSGGGSWSGGGGTHFFPCFLEVWH
ncbi:hypothetical protein ZWY2020_051844 [Hordeum vulgare]|nr:hypothetical protein ZWY2020_051844 [Hordeum vulgare]